MRRATGLVLLIFFAGVAASGITERNTEQIPAGDADIQKFDAILAFVRARNGARLRHHIAERHR
jgi:hypothetical protein